MPVAAAPPTVMVGLVTTVALGSLFEGAVPVAYTGFVGPNPVAARASCSFGVAGKAAVTLIPEGTRNTAGTPLSTGIPGQYCTSVMLNAFEAPAFIVVGPSGASTGNCTCKPVP